jgi:hypothetical protein
VNEKAGSDATAEGDGDAGPDESSHFAVVDQAPAVAAQQTADDAAPLTSESIAVAIQQTATDDAAPLTSEPIAAVQQTESDDAAPLASESIAVAAQQTADDAAPLTSESIAVAAQQTADDAAPLTSESIAVATQQTADDVAPLTNESIAVAAQQAADDAAPLTSESIVVAVQQTASDDAVPLTSESIVVAVQQTASDDAVPLTSEPIAVAAQQTADNAAPHTSEPIGDASQHDVSDDGAAPVSETSGDAPQHNAVSNVVAVGESSIDVPQQVAPDDAPAPVSEQIGNVPQQADDDMAAPVNELIAAAAAAPISEPIDGALQHNAPSNVVPVDDVPQQAAPDDAAQLDPCDTEVSDVGVVAPAGPWSPHRLADFSMAPVRERYRQVIQTNGIGVVVTEESASPQGVHKLLMKMVDDHLACMPYRGVCGALFRPWALDGERGVFVGDDTRGWWDAARVERFLARPEWIVCLAAACATASVAVSEVEPFRLPLPEPARRTHGVMFDELQWMLRAYLCLVGYGFFRRGRTVPRTVPKVATGISYDELDLVYDSGITVWNWPDYCTDAVVAWYGELRERRDEHDMAALRGSTGSGLGRCGKRLRNGLGSGKTTVSKPRAPYDPRWPTYTVDPYDDDGDDDEKKNQRAYAAMLAYDARMRIDGNETVEGAAWCRRGLPSLDALRWIESWAWAVDGPTDTYADWKRDAATESGPSFHWLGARLLDAYRLVKENPEALHPTTATVAEARKIMRASKLLDDSHHGGDRRPDYVDAFWWPGCPLGPLDKNTTLSDHDEQTEMEWSEFVDWMGIVFWLYEARVLTDTAMPFSFIRGVTYPIPMATRQRLFLEDVVLPVIDRNNWRGSSQLGKDGATIGTFVEAWRDIGLGKIDAVNVRFVAPSDATFQNYWGEARGFVLVGRRPADVLDRDDVSRLSGAVCVALARRKALRALEANAPQPRRQRGRRDGDADPDADYVPSGDEAVVVRQRPSRGRQASADDDGSDEEEEYRPSDDDDDRPNPSGRRRAKTSRKGSAKNPRKRKRGSDDSVEQV